MISLQTNYLNKAKGFIMLWGIFLGLGCHQQSTDNGNTITKTYDGNKEELLKDVPIPSVKEFVAN